ncbi:MAG: Nif3-like dinuclear metal center hexameric protein [Methanobrevibacter sp.]|jgi:dinuclear metal center YbgI/SA1388 family protein|nr:Nif3-like dinuclear metal center hexameric protein [Candidatus Methanovirga basalitermitum]
MKVIELIKIIEDLIPKELALKDDKVGYLQQNSNINIEKIKVVMDLYPKDDLNSNENELFITHHHPLFIPKTPTYVIHSNWDVISGGANDALAKILDLKVLDNFDKKNGIGRICSCQLNFKEFLKLVSEKLSLPNINVVNPLDDDVVPDKIAIVSGFGLSNMEYVKLVKKKNVSLFLSGDLIHKVAILGGDLDICLIDANHHKSEIPGLIELYNLISTIGLDTELIIQNIPWKTINFENKDIFNRMG